MNYSYFYYRSRGFLAMARRYEAQGNFENALWCCKRSLDFVERGLTGLIEVSQTTNQRHQARIRLIEEITNQIKGRLND